MDQADDELSGKMIVMTFNILSHQIKKFIIIRSPFASIVLKVFRFCYQLSAGDCVCVRMTDCLESE